MLVPALVLMLFAGSLAELPPGAVLRLGDHRFRASGEVRHIRFSADGLTLTGWVARSDGSLRPVAWNAATGFVVALPADRPPPNLPDGTTTAVLLRGERILTAGPGNVGRVWDATTSRELAKLAGHAAPVTAVTASTDGQRLATADAGGLVRVWDGDTFRPLSEPRGHLAAVQSIRVSPDNKKAVTVGADGTARVWNLATGAELRAFNVVGPVGFTADGLGLVSRVGGRMIVRDIVTGMEMVPEKAPLRPELTDGDASSLRGDWVATSPSEVSPNERMQATAFLDGGIGLVELASGEMRRVIRRDSASLALAFTPDGTRLLTAESDHTVLVWDVRPQTMPLPASVRRETNAAKLWATMCVGKADVAYLAMARLAVEPAAAVATARMRMRPAGATETDSPALRLADSRAIELLESVGTPDARDFLKEIASGEGSVWRTQEAKRALERMRK